MSEGFRRQVFDFAERHGIPIIRLCAQNAQIDCGRRPMQDAHRN